MPNNVLKIRPIAEEFNLTSTIYTKLKQAIATMNIYDDDVELKLDERSLSEQFGISRTPLREALARLDQEGLVRIVPRRGIYLVRKSKDEILDMILAWAALESMAARLVTEMASDEEISTLRKIVGKVDPDELSAHLDEYSELNIKFHQTILELSKSEQLFKMADEILMHVRAIRARTIGEGDRATKSVVDHMHIIEAIESRDANLAAQLVREHTLKLREHVALNFHID
jgi:DNA-binding GntR family transcriptional regulator